MPQMTKRQHIGNQIDAAMILARAECVSVTDDGSPEGRTPFRSALTTGYFVSGTLNSGDIRIY